MYRWWTWVKNQFEIVWKIKKRCWFSVFEIAWTFVLCQCHIWLMDYWWLVKSSTEFGTFWIDYMRRYDWWFCDYIVNLKFWWLVNSIGICVEWRCLKYLTMLLLLFPILMTPSLVDNNLQWVLFVPNVVKIAIWIVKSCFTIPNTPIEWLANKIGPW